MKQVFLVFFTMILFFSCQREINVSLTKEPGSVTGQVRPESVLAKVGLYQGDLIAETETQSGIFRFDRVSPGTYRLIARAEGFSQTEISGIRVEDGETHDVGTLELAQLPWPLLTVQPYDRQKNVPVYKGYKTLQKRIIILSFSQLMDEESLRKGFFIHPQVADLEITPHVWMAANRYEYYFGGEFDFNTEYTFGLDTTVQTVSGEKLEFPFSATFTTERFGLADANFHYDPETNGGSVSLSFNGLLTATAASHISLPAGIPFYTQQKYTSRIYVLPSVSWPSDSSITVTIDKDLAEIGGQTLGKDTTFTFRTAPLQVVGTLPHQGEQFVDQDESVTIRFNNVLDQSSLESNISISPAVPFTSTLSVSQGKSALLVTPDTLYANTEYTVKIGSGIKDFFGVGLSQEFNLTFKTK
ncbi:MAG TPA: hypothetical protein ENJ89_01780 [Caldithrix abyssi]|uniref:SbsA Ig-like domain-containing protein n=1 Tax=Caldithrix abyssi TaxID=187145 RepID=A0A7V5UE70_CALAY|nr:hypothetical protein [Caldithrix abyssi]